MKIFKGYNPDTGSPIKGTLETIQSCYFIEGFYIDEKTGEVIHEQHQAGHYEDYIETVEQVVEDGQPMYLDENGDSVPLNKIVFEKP